jgi:hypothetical protein
MKYKRHCMKLVFRACQPQHNTKRIASMQSAQNNKQEQQQHQHEGQCQECCREEGKIIVFVASILMGYIKLLHFAFLLQKTVSRRSIDHIAIDGTVLRILKTASARLFG